MNWTPFLGHRKRGFYMSKLSYEDKIGLYNDRQKGIDEINFLPRFKGIIVKEGTELYNKYGCFLSQCISHIQRYLKGIYDFVEHKGPKKLSVFLVNIII